MMDQFSYSEITDGDYEMARSWCEGHGRSFISSEFLPATGFKIYCEEEPIVMLWMYFDNSCPVTFVEWVISRPGLTPAQTSAALFYAIDTPVSRAMIFHGAKVACTRSPKAFVRYMVKKGWRIEDRELYSMVYVLREVEVFAV